MTSNCIRRRAPRGAPCLTSIRSRAPEQGDRSTLWSGSDADVLAIRGDSVGGIGEDDVRSVAAADRVAPAAHGVDAVVAVVAEDLVVVETGIETVVAGPAVDDVVAAIAGDVVVALVAEDLVVALAAIDLVVARPAVHLVVAVLAVDVVVAALPEEVVVAVGAEERVVGDRKSTRLNSSHLGTSYAVFCS